MKIRLLIDLFLLFFKIGIVSFGGGQAMLPLVKDEVSKNKKWIEEDEMIDIITIAQSLPGAIIINVATAVGYKVYKIKGSIVSSLGVVIPSFIIIISISLFFANIQDNLIVRKAFIGIRGVVVALLFNAFFKFYRMSIKNLYNAFVFIFSVIAMLVFNLSPMILIVIIVTLSLFISYLKRRKS